MGGSFDHAFFDGPLVAVVHCVDTEGPIGGDVRRNPDGSKEFMDNWSDIKQSLRELVNDDYRNCHRDSFNFPLKFNWFIMDFTGFSTNPKNRICEYHDTYDNIKSLNTSIDAFHWHYHQPPKSGIGDQWSDDWDSSNEHYNILGRRILDREDFPEAFRAGGTIEDEKCSMWLNDNLMIDFSNRVSSMSVKTENIFDFNWFGAPMDWFPYNPSHGEITAKGDMRRVIARSVDIKSRLHELQYDEVLKAFNDALSSGNTTILSYFSHDHRDMREETSYAIQLVKKASEETGVPFKWMCAKDAVKQALRLPTRENDIQVSITGRNAFITFRHRMFQKNPFVYTLSKAGNIKYHKLDVKIHPACPHYYQSCTLEIPEETVKIGVACTDMSGDKCVEVVDVY
jgi:hypothetical protein